MNTSWILTTIIISFVSCALILIKLYTPQPRKALACEKEFTNYSNEKRERFPSLEEDEGSIDLSIIVPAYKEKDRLPRMLEETLHYCEQRRLSTSNFTYEVIIVDDGSNDNGATANIPRDIALSRGRDSYVASALRLLKLEKNRGKGGAVTQGMLSSRGRLLLMADADGATQIEDVEKLELAISSARSQTAVAIGSRAHLEDSDVVVERHPIRNFLMHGFHLVVRVLGVGGFKDTQCGFKLFSRQAARLIFPIMHVEGWIFDVECLYIAQKRSCSIAEVPVRWEEKDGSKLALVSDSIKMARDLFVIRFNYLFNLNWKISTNN